MNSKSESTKNEKIKPKAKQSSLEGPNTSEFSPKEKTTPKAKPSSLVRDTSTELSQKEKKTAKAKQSSLVRTKTTELSPKAKKTPKAKPPSLVRSKTPELSPKVKTTPKAKPPSLVRTDSNELLPGTSKNFRRSSSNASISSVTSCSSYKSYSSQSTDVLSDNSTVETKKVDIEKPKKKVANKFENPLSDDIGSSQFSKNDFCLIQYVSDKNFNVVKISEIGEPKVVSLEKVHTVKYGSQYVKCVVKFVGSRSKCEEKYNLISSYSNEQTPAPKKRKVPTTSILDIEKLTKENDSKESNEFLKKKVKELEERLQKKTEECMELKDGVKRKEEIIKCYRKSYDDNAISKHLEMSLNFIKLYGSPEDLTCIPFYCSNKQNIMHMISANYPKINVTKDQKLELDSYLQTPSESDTSIFRKTIGVLLPVDEVWAIRDKARIKRDFPNEVFAAYEYVTAKRDGFTFSMAENVCRCLCNEARRRLRNLGFEFVKNEDEENSNSPIYIISSPNQRTDFKRKKLSVEDNEE